MKTKYIVIAAIILICSFITYKLIVNKKELDMKASKVPNTNYSIPVKAATVKDSILELNINKTGTVIPFKEAKALATISGNLNSLRYALGTQVTKGQVVAVIDSRAEQLNLQQAERNAAKLRSDLSTYNELLAGKATTREKVDEMRANYNDAITQINLIRKNLSDAVVKAPATGMISSKPVEQGMFVNPGDEIATIIDISKTKVEAFLSESEVYKIRKGQIVEVLTDVFPNKVFKGTVDYISPQADEVKSYQIQIILDKETNTLLRSGTYVNVKFVGGEKTSTLLIPREALIGSIKDPYVFIVSNGKVEKRSIKVGLELGGSISVLEGLKAKEQVVTSGQINLKQGSKVKISQ